MAPLFRGVRVCAYVFMCERQKERGSEKLGALWKVCVCSSQRFGDFLSVKVL